MYCEAIKVAIIINRYILIITFSKIFKKRYYKIAVSAAIFIKYIVERAFKGIVNLFVWFIH